MSILLYAPPHLQVPITSLKGIGPKQAETLAQSKFALTSVQDLLQHYPRRHLDFSNTKSIREVGIGEEVTVIGEVIKVSPAPPGRRRFPLKVRVSDGTSVLEIAFFNQHWRAQQLKPGTMIAAKGKVTTFKGARQMTAPLVDVIKDADEVIKIVPQYPATADIHTAWLRRVIRGAIDQFAPLEDPLAQALLDRHDLKPRTWAMANYHFPKEMSDKAIARRRLVFDELFTLQLGLAYRKRRIERETMGIAHKVEAKLAGRFVECLPFTATKAQTRSIEEIENDMSRAIPMHRLLQGEVGSGKTVVALYAALLAVQGGYQAAIMAPTEVLANQHYLTITKLLAPLAGHPDLVKPGQLDMFGGPEAVLMTGSVPAARKREILAKVADGSASIVIGTHALIQEGVEFANLGLAIIDEQHRFGVRQRMSLKQKGAGGVAPDILIMTATPIPRTLAFTLYGDLDVSVLDELPKGRLPVETQVIADQDRKAAYDLIRTQVAQGRQAYVITPLIEESDKLQVRSAETESKRLATEVFPDLKIAVMHGRMAPKNKEAVMEGFRNGDIDVLISTTVVEVGVDVPNATVMLIEDADRFGLSQLHQLRGRIGRGSHSSTCLLMTAVEPNDEPNDAFKRLKVMTETSDGFELANKDLELRGTGTILGERQSGFSDLRLTHLVRDIDILKRARDEAFSLIDEDHNLTHHPSMRLEMEGRFAGRLDWLLSS
ncbi:MAG: ATP-dependent DNA helicase RecG [Actinomycetota bacterium]